MHILHQARWFGLSLALHLAVASGLIVLTVRDTVHSPTTIMVTLDNLDAPLLPQPQAATRAVLRPVQPARPARPPAPHAEPVTAEQPRPAPSPVMAPSTAHDRPPGQSLVSEAPQASAAVTTTITNRPTSVIAAPPVQQTVAAAKPPSLEKSQQRYVKEHFTYIRELITKRLVYPPMARKMNWSGKVVVAFTINEDGSVHAIRVHESSGFKILDKSALDTVRSVAPFPKPPVRAEIVVPISFKLM